MRRSIFLALIPIFWLACGPPKSSEKPPQEQASPPPSPGGEGEGEGEAKGDSDKSGADACACSGDEVCCWNGDKKAGRCAASGACDPSASETELGCVSAEACGEGKECCQSPMGSLACQAAGSCVQSMGATLCDELADCQLIAGSIEAKDCAPRDNYPSSMKFCNYP